MESVDRSSLWANKKCLIICCAVALANTQYGLDTAAVGGLQAMPGFLRVFGYEDPSLPLGYGIDVSDRMSRHVCGKYRKLIDVM